MNKDLFMQILARREDPDLLAEARRLMEWAQANSLPLRWSAQGETPAFVPVAGREDGERIFVEVTAKGRVDILFSKMMESGPFQDEDMRLELLRRLNKIEGLSIPTFTIDKQPNFSLAALSNDAAFAIFTEVFEWVLAR